MKKLNLVFFAAVIILIVQPVQANPNGQLSHALTNFAAAQYDAALTQLKLLSSQQQNDPMITYYLARSYFHDGQFKQARTLLEASIRNHPDHSESHFLLGSVKMTMVSDVNLFRKLGLVRSALTSWQDAVALNGQHIEGRYGIASFYTSAPGIVGGDLEKARSQLKLLRQISEPYSLLVDSSLSAKDDDFVTAEKLLLEAIAAIPDRAFPTLILANFYFRQDRFRDALEAVESYRQRHRTWNDPNESQTALLAGRIYVALDDVANAKREFNLALTSKPSNALKKQIKKGLNNL